MADTDGSQATDVRDDVLHFSTKAKKEEKRDLLFTIDEKEYTILLNPSPAIGLRYMQLCRDSNVEAATAYIIEAMIGEEGYEALANCEDVTQDQFDHLMTIIVRKALGNQEAPKVPRGLRGRRR